MMTGNVLSVERCSSREHLACVQAAWAEAVSVRKATAAVLTIKRLAEEKRRVLKADFQRMVLCCCPDIVSPSGMVIVPVHPYASGLYGSWRQTAPVKARHTTTSILTVVLTEQYWLREGGTIHR